MMDKDKTPNIPPVRPILVDLPMPIVTPRLLIRPVSPGDGAAMHAAKTESWDSIKNWMPWAKALGCAEDDEAVARQAYAKFLLREDFMMVACDRETGRLLVFTGLHRFDWTVRRMEIGYWCRKNATGTGYVSESTNALTRYAFDVLSARTVALCHADGNEKSRRVIERLNFVPEGRNVGACITNDGVLRDHLWYSMTDKSRLPALDVTWGI